MSSARKMDTLQFANKLKESGMPDKQAETLAELEFQLYESTLDNLATKADIESLKSVTKADIEALKSSTKEDLRAAITRLEINFAADLKAAIACLETSVIKWVVGISFAQAALIVSLLKFFH